VKIVFLDAGTLSTAASLTPLEDLGDLHSYAFTEPKDVARRIRDARVVITNKVPITSNDIQSLSPKSLIIVAASVVDGVDEASARERDITVTPVTGYATESVAQWTWTLILALLGRVEYYADFVRSAGYSSQRQFSHVGAGFSQVAGRRLGIIGFGRIGQRVGFIGRAFGADVVYYSISGEHKDNAYLRLELDELLSTSDIVSLHTFRSPLTENMLDDSRLSLMKPGSFLINTGRGGVVDELALARHLSIGTLRGAALDVYDQEPLPKSSPLIPLAAQGRVILTPHSAWGGDVAQSSLIHEMVEHITRLSGGTTE
jgi:glycerate dehydrogenase